MSIKKPAFLAALAGIVTAFAYTAYAGDEMSQSQEEKPAESAFSDIDANKDGAISQQEASAKNSWLAQNFNAIDTNKDGRISKQEYDKALS